MSGIELNVPASKSSLPSAVSDNFDFIRITFFEFFATGLFAYGIVCSQNIAPSSYPVTGAAIPNPGHSIFVSFALFLGICFCGQFTGGHCNPAVTLVFLMKKNSGINLHAAVLYWISQFAGAFAGCAIASGIVQEYLPAFSTTTGGNVAWQLFRDFLGQIIGTFFFTFMILILTTKETTFISSTFATYFLIVTFLYVARTFTFRTEGLNPAIGFGIEFWYSVTSGNWTALAQSFVMILGPIPGAILSSLFFEHFYRPAMILWKAKSV